MTQTWHPPAANAHWRAGGDVVAALHAAGYQAVYVGGAVRDLLLGRPVHDVDVATNATPDQVMAAWPRCEPVGKAFGVVIAVTAAGPVEVASFRSDGVYIDGRRPSSVVATDEAGDVWRRDFTINALVADPIAGEIRDHVGGLADLESRCLRVVGNARARLLEDRLRVLRAIRFVSHLDLSWEPNSLAAVRSITPSDLSRERIWQEWGKGLDERPGTWLRAVATSGHLSALCDRFDLARVPLAAAALDRLGDHANPLLLAAASCLCLPPAELHAFNDWLRREPVSKSFRVWLPRLLDETDPPTCDQRGRRRRMAADDADQVLRWWQALGHDAAALAEWSADAAAVGALGALPLSGADLIAAGVAPGPAVGAGLAYWRDQWLSGAFADRESLLAAVARDATGAADH